MTKAEFLAKVQSGQREFENIDLEHVDLSYSKLTGLTFIDCFITASFCYADLSYTKFYRGNIKTCDFRNANLSYATMEMVAFESTIFKGALTTGFSFINNYSYNAAGIGQADFDNWIYDTE